jgi:hypothetical protein
MPKLHINPVVRAVGLFAAVAALVTSVTFAALNSQVTLSSNSISTTTASLKLWDGDSFESTAPGFTVTELVPGTGKEFPFYFQNTGSADLDITAHVPVAPTASGFTGWENLEVTFTSNAPGCVDGSVETDMQALLAGEVALPCNPLSGGSQGNSGVEATEGNYKVKFDIDPSAISGSSATVGSFDIVFTGTQASTVTPGT